MENSEPIIIFSAEDLSGDQNVAPTISALKSALPQLRFVGIGGPAMVTAGLEPVLPFERFSVMGFQEVVPRIPFMLEAQSTMKRLMKRLKPAALVCVDSSGFNMPLAKEAKRLGIPVIWFIAPMSWAWKKNKHVANLRDLALQLAVIFPFEEEFFKKFFPHVCFVGNPSVEALGNADAPARVLPSNRPVRLAIVPGSRRQEITKMLPLMLEAASKLRHNHPNIEILVSKSPNQPKKMYEPFLAGTDAKLFDGPMISMLDECDIAAVTSGTATLQTALRGLPHAVVYKTSAITFHIVKRAVDIRWIGLPNIVAQKTVVPELIQDAATPEALAAVFENWLSNNTEYARVSGELANLRGSLGAKKPSLELAAIIRKCARI